LKRNRAKRVSFLIEQGWEPVQERQITMWRDPHPSPRPGGGTRHQVLWPHEAEFRADCRVALVRRVMED
jgi:hypothetical protein